MGVYGGEGVCRLKDGRVSVPDDEIMGNDFDVQRPFGFRQHFNQRLQEMEQFESSLRVIPLSDIDNFHIRSQQDARAVVAANLTLAGIVNAGPDSVRITFDLRETQNGRSVRSWSVTE